MKWRLCIFLQFLCILSLGVGSHGKRNHNNNLLSFFERMVAASKITENVEYDKSNSNFETVSSLNSNSDTDSNSDVNSDPNSQRGEKFRFEFGSNSDSSGRVKESNQKRKPFKFIHNAGLECGGILEGNSGRLTYERNSEQKDKAALKTGKENAGHGNCIWILRIQPDSADTSSPIETRIVVTMEKLKLSLRSSLNFYSEDSLLAQNSKFPKAIKLESYSNSIVRIKGQSLVVVLSAEEDADSLFTQFRWDVEFWQGTKANRPMSEFNSKYEATTNYTIPLKSSPFTGKVEWNSKEFQPKQRSSWILNADKSNSKSNSPHLKSCGQFEKLQGQNKNLLVNLTVDLETEQEDDFNLDLNSASDSDLDSDSDAGIRSCRKLSTAAEHSEINDDTDDDDACVRANFQLFEILDRGRLKRVLSHCRGKLSLSIPKLTNQLLAFIHVNSSETDDPSQNQNGKGPLKSAEISWQLPATAEKNQNEAAAENSQQEQSQKVSNYPVKANGNSLKKGQKPQQQQQQAGQKVEQTINRPNSNSNSNTKSKGSLLSSYSYTRQRPGQRPGQRPKNSAFVSTTSTTEMTFPLNMYLEADPLIQLQLSSRQPATKLSKCPSSETIYPCTCSVFQGEVQAECSGPLVTGERIKNLFSGLRRSNKLGSGQWLYLGKLQILNTQLSSLDLRPLFGLETKLLDISFNKKMHQFDVVYRKRINLDLYPDYMIPRLPLIRTKKLRAVDNSLTDAGFGKTLIYFAPNMEELILSKNQLAGNFKSEDEPSPAMMMKVGGEDELGVDVEFLPGLSAFTQLTRLYLSQNRIKRLKSGQFKTNSRLVFLGLSANEMEQVAEQAFHIKRPSSRDESDINNLRQRTLTIDLSRNLLSEKGFPPNNGLESVGRYRPVFLNLDQNKFETLNSDTFESFLMVNLNAAANSGSDSQPNLEDIVLTGSGTRTGSLSRPLTGTGSGAGAGSGSAKNGKVNQMSVRANPLKCDFRVSWLQGLRTTLSRSVMHAWCVNDPHKSIFTSNLVHDLSFHTEEMNPFVLDLNMKKPVQDQQDDSEEEN